MLLFVRPVRMFFTATHASVDAVPRVASRARGAWSVAVAVREYFPLLETLVANLYLGFGPV